MNIIDAVIENNKELLLQEISDGNINAKEPDSGMSALHYCAQNYNIEFAKILLENGAETDITDAYGNTPLFKAVYFSEGRTEMINLLIESGADVNHKNTSDISPKQLAFNIDNFDVTSCFNSL